MIKKHCFILTVLLLSGVTAAAPLWSATVIKQPSEALEKIGVDARMGQTLPLELIFQDEAGREVRLGDYFTDKPVLLTPVYYRCPMLCSLVLNGLVQALKILKFTPGQEFDIVTFTIDPEEKSEAAAAKKENYLKEYKRPGAEKGWHFLSGPAGETLAEALGFKYIYDPKNKEYGHGAAIIVATPDGKISRYFYGISFSPKDLRLAFVEAAGGKIGSLIDQVILLCYHYDPATGKYGFIINTVIRGAGLLTALLIAGFIILSLRKDGRDKSAAITSSHHE